MVHMNGFWACVNYVLSFLTFSPFGDPGRALQSPLLNPSDVLHHDRPLRGPKFKPPGGEVDDSFVCSYPTMTDYESCSTPEDRSCWLINPKTRDRFDIKTDYETRAPVGVLREYWLNITDSHVNTDGQDFPLAKLFNSTYPGPWIQACWGDVGTPLPTDFDRLTQCRMSRSTLRTTFSSMVLAFIGTVFGS
jgi:hypothetical protein